MKYIAHRGNLNGPNPTDENKPEYILKAIGLGFECEIDVRYIQGEWFLGHDTPDYKVELEFLLDNSDKFWIHCKNTEALNQLIQYSQLNIFWHQNDDYTLTSKHFIWCYPGKTILPGNSISVMPEWNQYYLPEHCYGVCSDYVEKIQNRQI